MYVCVHCMAGLPEQLVRCTYQEDQSCLCYNYFISRAILHYFQGRFKCGANLVYKAN